jgi:hypothetical protein
MDSVAPASAGSKPHVRRKAAAKTCYLQALAHGYFHPKQARVFFVRDGQAVSCVRDDERAQYLIDHPIYFAM